VPWNDEGISYGCSPFRIDQIWLGTYRNYTVFPLFCKEISAVTGGKSRLCRRTGAGTYEKYHNDLAEMKAFAVDHMTEPTKNMIFFAIICQKVLAKCAKVMYTDRAIL
jgi:hypothetical protein